MTVRPHQLLELTLPAEGAAWQRSGFDGGDQIRLGSTWLLPNAKTAELQACIDGVTDLDGLALAPAASNHDNSDAVEHPNTAVSIDHIVVTTPDCDRTTSRFEQAGIEARRVRVLDSPKGKRRQTFFWLGDVVCELVGPDAANGDGPASWWGLAITVHDLDGARSLLGDHATDTKTAVQPGRRVCTVRSSAALGVPTLLISPHVQATSSQSANG